MNASDILIVAIIVVGTVTAVALHLEVKKKEEAAKEAQEAEVKKSLEPIPGFDQVLYHDFENRALDCGYEAFDAERIARSAVNFMNLFPHITRDNAFNQVKNSFDAEVLKKKYAPAEEGS